MSALVGRVGTLYAFATRSCITQDRTRTAMKGAKKSAGCAGPHIHALPDDLLLRILKLSVLTDDDMFAALPLVCKRWVKVAPLAVESAACLAYGEDCSTRLLSLYSWLAQHSATGNLWQLRIEIDMDETGGELQQQATRALLLHSVLPACTHLHELELHLDGFRNHHLGLEGWAGNLVHLRSLTLFYDSEAAVTAQLQGLTCMQELCLGGEGLTFSEGAVLPPLLTQLAVCNLQGEHLPAQLSALTALQALQLSRTLLPAGGYSGLTALTWLKRLRLTCSTHLPSCLPQLTHLPALNLDETPFRLDSPAVVAAAQEEAVESLPNLVHLTLSVPLRKQSSRVPRLPATLATLSRLQSLKWDVCQADYLALPPGPYLASLTRLEMHTPTVVANLERLSEHAGQLVHLTLLADAWQRPGDAEGKVAVACWAGCHAPLQCLRINRTPCTAALKVACQQARKRKGGLEIEVAEGAE